MFYFRIRTQVPKDEIASGELMYTVWKNTQLATQIRGECSKLTLLSPSRPPEKKNWPHTTRGFEPVISVQEAIFSVSLNSYFKAPLFFSWKFQMWHMWQCNTKGMLFRRINPWKMSQCVSLCSSRSFTTRQPSQATLHGRYFNGYERILAVPQKWYLVVFRRKAATRAG